MLEKHTHYYKTIQIPHKDSFSVEQAMKELKEEFGNPFSKVFKTIICDNGSEFSNMSDIEHYGTKVYFALPYSSWERGQNERHNRLLRQYLPKKCSISAYTQDDILHFGDKINRVLGKSLNYQTAEELFDAYLDKIYAL